MISYQLMEGAEGMNADHRILLVPDEIAKCVAAIEISTLVEHLGDRQIDVHRRNATCRPGRNVAVHGQRRSTIDDTGDHSSRRHMPQGETLNIVDDVVLDTHVHLVEHVLRGEEGIRGIVSHVIDATVHLDRLAAQVKAEDLLARLPVRTCDLDLAVDTAIAYYGGVKDVGTIGGKYHERTRVIESVHLSEEHRNDGAFHVRADA
ncbi:MAG: hypothetical protein UT30_C0002G0031 [Candidatus Uhrbacteria bacterium GW2011_GWF2_39_13]|uniref:Uncharacterized protein n=1 Tax=Candidatus Uhrbacteria bacterium GW2011_GWF2_39_13 TaxID=1618995 RepID=A0A0G0MLL7_9BACT|nr:MAG: hypothetical protein UT30_C0002G0031 [Candidatus Uhrbacteria bacterium GW2011_GWF2_39_13]